MKFQITMELDTDRDSANALGEYLRNKFWPPKKPYDYGCCSLFDFGPDVKVLAIREETYDEWFGTLDQDITTVVAKWTRGEWNGIICEYFWDGDGMLRFIFPNGTAIYNGDCKKSSWIWEMNK